MPLEDWNVGLAKHIAGLALSLARAGIALVRIRKTETRMFEHPDRHLDGPLVGLADEIAARQKIGKLIADRLADLLVMPQPVARAAREQLVPGRLCGNSDH